MGTETQFFADYMDGVTARISRVCLKLESETLRIELPDGNSTEAWTLNDLRLIPDQADQTSIIIGRTGDHPARIKITDLSLAAVLTRICPDLKRPSKTPHLMRRLAILSTSAVASVALIIFVLVPVMADQLALMLPAEGEKALGDTTYEQIRQALGDDSGLGVWECGNKEGVAALNKMVDRLTQASDFPYKIRMHVLDHEMVNAFALPGGHIILFRGLIKDARSAEEIAGVLGHEMGHVSNRDPTRLALRSAGSVGVLGLLLGDFAGGAAVLFLTEKLIQAQYSRGAEAGSDLFAHDMLAATGLPSAPMGDFFLRLKSDYGDEEGLLSHLASHPDLQGRADAARAADTVGKDFEPVLTYLEWRQLKAICN